MLPDLDPIYVVHAFAAVAVVLAVEAVYLLFFTRKSYRDRVNRRLRVLHKESDRQQVLVQLRRERGLTAEGVYRLPFTALNRLILQSGLTLGVNRLVAVLALSVAGFFVLVSAMGGRPGAAAAAAVVLGILGPLLALRMIRSRRQKLFGEQFPDAIDIIVRSLRAGHPVPVAVAMVSRETQDPVGTEFGMAADEITYGADMETAMRNLLFRVGQEDLPLFVTAVSIQGTTGGNLGEILANLSKVIRERFKMRRKIRALSSEARFSALILSGLPFVVFGVLFFIAPNHYGDDVWADPLTIRILSGAIAWMLIGNFMMYKMVNFRI